MKIYKNQRGSILELEFKENNAVRGYFTTAVAGKECQQVIGEKRPIIGHRVGNALSFSVAYEPCGSVFSVAGNFDSTETKIDVLGLVVRQSAGEPEKDCGNRLISHDSYHLID